MRTKDQQRQEGAAAFEAGQSIHDCPYAPDDNWQGYIQWRIGHKSAERTANHRRNTVA